MGTWDQPSEAFTGALNHANTVRQRYLDFEPPAPPPPPPPPTPTTPDPPENLIPTMPSLAQPYWGGISDVKEAYTDLLGREADDEGLAFWTNQKLKPADLLTQFQNSQEYKDRQAANPNTSFMPGINSVEEAYRELLGRDPDQAGLDFWNQQGWNNDTARRFYDTEEAKAYRASDAFKNYWNTPLGAGGYATPPAPTDPLPIPTDPTAPQSVSGDARADIDWGPLWDAGARGYADGGMVGSSPMTTPQVQPMTTMPNQAGSTPTQSSLMGQITSQPGSPFAANMGGSTQSGLGGLSNMMGLNSPALPGYQPGGQTASAPPTLFSNPWYSSPAGQAALAGTTFDPNFNQGDDFGMGSLVPPPPPGGGGMMGSPGQQQSFDQLRSLMGMPQQTGGFNDAVGPITFNGVPMDQGGQQLFDNWRAQSASPSSGIQQVSTSAPNYSQIMSDFAAQQGPMAQNVAGQPGMGLMGLGAGPTAAMQAQQQSALGSSPPPDMARLYGDMQAQMQGPNVGGVNGGQMGMMQSPAQTPGAVPAPQPQPAVPPALPPSAFQPQTPQAPQGFGYGREFASPIARSQRPAGFGPQVNPGTRPPTPAPSASTPGQTQGFNGFGGFEGGLGGMMSRFGQGGPFSSMFGGQQPQYGGGQGGIFSGMLSQFGQQGAQSPFSNVLSRFSGGQTPGGFGGLSQMMQGGGQFGQRLGQLGQRFGQQMSSMLPPSSFGRRG